MFHICRAAMFAMMKRRSGRIVAVSSVCGAYDHSAPHARPAHQGAAHHWPVRAGIAGFVPALSALTSRFGVSVNAVTPGTATHDMTAILPELTRADLTETVALRRFDDASDVADLVAFLLSAACGITGHVLELRSPITLLGPVEGLGVPERAAHRRLVAGERPHLEVRLPAGHRRCDPAVRAEPEPEPLVVTGISDQHHHGLAERVARA
jgi:hypothetical protein